MELLRIDDVHAPPIGTKGTVTGVDDTASVMVAWDNGSSLHVIYGEDACRKLDTVKTICYGKEDVWDSRKEAADFFLRAIAGSEGSECERYNSRFKSTGQERFWVRNGDSAANLNTIAHISLLAIAMTTVVTQSGVSFRCLKSVKRIA